MVAPTPPAPSPYTANNNTSPGFFAATIAVSDTVNNPLVYRAIFVGGAGDIAVITPNSTTPVIFSAVPAGTVLPVMNTRINNTNTTASLMIGIG